MKKVFRNKNQTLVGRRDTAAYTYILYIYYDRVAMIDFDGIGRESSLRNAV